MCPGFLDTQKLPAGVASLRWVQPQAAQSMRFRGLGTPPVFNPALTCVCQIRSRSGAWRGAMMTWARSAGQPRGMRPTRRLQRTPRGRSCASSVPSWSWRGASCARSTSAQCAAALGNLMPLCPWHACRHCAFAMRTEGPYWVPGCTALCGRQGSGVGPAMVIGRTSYPEGAVFTNHLCQDLALCNTRAGRSGMSASCGSASARSSVLPGRSSGGPSARRCRC